MYAYFQVSSELRSFQNNYFRFLIYVSYVWALRSKSQVGLFFCFRRAVNFNFSFFVRSVKIYYFLINYYRYLELHARNAFRINLSFGRFTNFRRIIFLSAPSHFSSLMFLFLGCIDHSTEQGRLKIKLHFLRRILRLQINNKFSN